MAEGIAPLFNFAASYRKSPAGINHDLVILYKGYDGAGRLQAAKSVFAEFPHAAIEVPDTSFDIGSYLLAARRALFMTRCLF